MTAIIGGFHITIIVEVSSVQKGEGLGRLHAIQPLINNLLQFRFRKHSSYVRTTDLWTRDQIRVCGTHG